MWPASASSASEPVSRPPTTVAASSTTLIASAIHIRRRLSARRASSAPAKAFAPAVRVCVGHRGEINPPGGRATRWSCSGPLRRRRCPRRRSRRRGRRRPRSQARSPLASLIASAAISAPSASRAAVLLGLHARDDEALDLGRALEQLVDLRVAEPLLQRALRRPGGGADEVHQRAGRPHRDVARPSASTSSPGRRSAGSRCGPSTKLAGRAVAPPRSRSQRRRAPAARPGAPAAAGRRVELSSSAASIGSIEPPLSR